MIESENNLYSESPNKNVTIQINSLSGQNNGQLNNNFKEKNKNKSILISSKHKKLNNYLISSEESSNNRNFLKNPKFNKKIKNDISSAKNNSSKSSKKRKNYKLPLFDGNNGEKDINNISEETKQIDEICLICEEKLTNKEKEKNYLECSHYFCNECYYSYFKVKINNNEVERIKCPEKDCKNIIHNNFIEEHLINDISLLEKYKKLRQRKQLMLDPNIQLCPFPDCESYAKKENNKYVSCIHNGHKFCFNCLKDWHNNEECKIDTDKSFEKWKDSYKVKRCPNCKYFIEKSEGCNHMTCSNCKYEFCWFCMQKYEIGHYDLNGKCIGLQTCDCLCFSNRICIFLYQILMYILKIIGFAIICPVFTFVMTYHALWDHFDIYNSPAEVISHISVIFLCLSTYWISLSVISSFISLLMVFIWPLQHKIFEAISEIF